MTRDDMVMKARILCAEAHDGQLDKAGQPYYLHPYAVAALVEDAGDDAVIVAYLHDVIEDTDITINDLRQMGFSEQVLQAMDAMTRRAGEDYSDFIERCAENDIALIVKRADLAHNTSPERSDSLPETLAKRYAKAAEILER